MGNANGLRPRRLAPVILDQMRTEPVVILTGPRTVGKSTLLAELASDLDRPILDLDQPATRAAVAADPSFMVSGAGPVLIDEFQHVPEVLDAIKAELNKDNRPGRFVLTGSTRYAVLPRAAQSLAGRAHIIEVLPLSQGELHGQRERFADLLWTDPEQLLRPDPQPSRREEYADRILTGGFPSMLHRATTRARTSWFADYTDLAVMRDVLDIAKIRQREALPRLFRQLAAQTGQLLNITRAGEQVGLDKSTANRYATLLEAAFMIQRLPAWAGAAGRPAVRHPKLHVIDSGLAASLLGLSGSKISARDPSALTDLGHVTKTFAVGEIRKQVSWSDTVTSLSHLRTVSGDEVDLILETWDGYIAGIEIKAGARVRDDDFNGLRLLRDKVGDRFVTGVLLNLGDLSYRYEDRILVAPMCTLWK